MPLDEGINADGDIAWQPLQTISMLQSILAELDRLGKDLAAVYVNSAIEAILAENNAMASATELPD